MTSRPAEFHEVAIRIGDDIFIARDVLTALT